MPFKPRLNSLIYRNGLFAPLKIRAYNCNELKNEPFITLKIVQAVGCGREYIHPSATDISYRSGKQHAAPMDKKYYPPLLSMVGYNLGKSTVEHLVIQTLLLPDVKCIDASMLMLPNLYCDELGRIKPGGFLNKFLNLVVKVNKRITEVILYNNINIVGFPYILNEMDKALQFNRFINHAIKERDGLRDQGMTIKDKDNIFKFFEDENLLRTTFPMLALTDLIDLSQRTQKLHSEQTTFTQEVMQNYLIELANLTSPLTIEEIDYIRLTIFNKYPKYPYAQYLTEQFIEHIPTLDYKTSNLA